MAKKKNDILGTELAIDHTHPVTEIVIDKQTYKLCFDMRALGLAEREFNKLSQKVNLVAAMPPRISVQNTQVLFACAAHKYHPELGLEGAIDLLTMPYISIATSLIIEAWEAAMPKPDPEADAQAYPTEASL